MARHYLFSDESGDLVFKPGHRVSRYFAVGTLSISEPELRTLRADLAAVRDELAWQQQGLDSTFHACEDNHLVRAAMFDALRKLDFRVDVTLLDKRKARPNVRETDPTFFQYAWFYHLRSQVRLDLAPGDELMVVAASLGTRKMRAAFREAIESVLKQNIPYHVKRTLAFWRDESDFGLAAVDYCLWAVTRYWERGDATYYNLINDKIGKVYDLWQHGQIHYY